MPAILADGRAARVRDLANEAFVGYNHPARRVGSQMIRPRFGLKLIFLITALVAVCIALRQAVEREERADREGQVIDLQVKLERLEGRRTAWEKWLSESGLPMTTYVKRPSGNVDSLSSFDSDIKDLKDQIDHLRR